MDNETKSNFLNEPPGRRRSFLALKAVGSSQEKIALACNCDRSLVSQVIGGANSTELHARIRATMAEQTGMEESWLFAHVPSHSHTVLENRTEERVMSRELGLEERPFS